ncbi:MAG: DNA-3-methyladenine glycosylase [Actinomycetota bacterium]|nr:DNA-3-methyladenine glycosylase [Actinomycetota bacterium]
MSAAAEPDGGPAPPRPLDRAFLARPSDVVAPELLNKVISVGDRSARIVEVEAYLGDGDPASHAHAGPTARNATMFGPAGHLYVYFTYGMHWCANVTCDAEGVGTAVLLRAGRPLTGVEQMWAARPAARRPRDLCSGPAKLCQALGIAGDDDGADLLGDGRVALGDDGTAPPRAPVRTTRIGITKAAERPLRWYVADDENVSRPAGTSRSRGAGR